MNYSKLKLFVLEKNWISRTLTATILVLYLILVTYVGSAALFASALAIQISCFYEIISIAYKYKQFPEFPLFRTLNWYFVFVFNYFLAGESFREHLDVYIKKYAILKIAFVYHRLISYCFYWTGIFWFLLSLRNNIVRDQFGLLVWVHFLGIVIVLQSYMIVRSTFLGIIWLLLPMLIVFLNDIMAYIFGINWGRTPLIKLSPNKTWEGFLAGILGSLLLGMIVAYVMCQYQYFICPIKFALVKNSIETTYNYCRPNYMFLPKLYDFKYFSLKLPPFIGHTINLSLFASIVAPFGGYFASGFKRAVRVKDFGTSFPGHGGITDRFDCQFLMATFVNVYIITFIRNSTIDGLVSKILRLSDDSQLEIFHLLNQKLNTSS